MQSPTANAKVSCPKCGKEGIRFKSLPFHQCYVAPSVEEEIAAWRGDVQHRSDVINYLISLGYTPAVSHTYLASFCSSKHQAAYMQEFQYLTQREAISNEHHRAQRFEARYITDTQFREDYKQRLLNQTAGVIHIMMPSERFSRMSLDNVLPNKKLFIDQSVLADSDLYAAMLRSLDD